MALKDIMLGTAIAALISGGAVAQDTNGNTIPSDTPAVEGSAAPETTADAAPRSDASERSMELAVEEPMTPEADVDTAEDVQETPVPRESDTAEAPADVQEMTVGQVIGSDVVGVDNQSVGEVDYVIAEGDSVSFVVGIGGFLGMGEYTVSLPAEQFSLDEEGALKLSSMTRRELEELPEYDETGAESLPVELRIGDLT